MSNPRPFPGFGRGTMRFLRDLAANNDREWFAEHKHRYEQHVVEPAFAFIEAMDPLLHDVSPHFLALTGKQGGSLMRVYKDTRFSKDKTPYKTNIGIQFRHEQGRDVHAPGYYLHVQPAGTPGDHGTAGSFLGVGTWRPPADALRAIRDRIRDEPDAWLQTRDDIRFTKRFTLAGDALKRPPRGYDPEHPCIDDLRRKDFIAVMPLKPTALAKPTLSEDAAAAFADAAPLMRFLCKALGVPY